jgi:hypothetical protein
MKQIASTIGILFIGSALFFGVGFLQTYVLLDLARLFDVPYLKEIEFWQYFGIVIIFAVLTLKAKPKDKEEDSEDEKIVNGLAGTISGAINVLIIWGLCYLAKFLFM